MKKGKELGNLFLTHKPMNTRIHISTTNLALQWHTKHKRVHLLLNHFVTFGYSPSYKNNWLSIIWGQKYDIEIPIALQDDCQHDGESRKKEWLKNRS